MATGHNICRDLRVCVCVCVCVCVSVLLSSFLFFLFCLWHDYVVSVEGENELSG